MKGWREFMVKYAPDADLHDPNYVNAYNSAMTLEQVLKPAATICRPGTL